MLVNKSIERTELAQLWSKVIADRAGNLPIPNCQWGVSIKPAGNLVERAGYLSKHERSYQKETPEGHESLGRWWGTFGGYNLEPKETFDGPAAEVAPAVRVIRKMLKKKCEAQGRKFPSDNGRYSFTARGLGKYADWVRRLFEPTKKTPVVEAAEELRLSTCVIIAVPGCLKSHEVSAPEALKVSKSPLSDDKVTDAFAHLIELTSPRDKIDNKVVSSPPVDRKQKPWFFYDDAARQSERKTHREVGKNVLKSLTKSGENSATNSRCESIHMPFVACSPSNLLPWCIPTLLHKEQLHA